MTGIGYCLVKTFIHLVLREVYVCVQKEEFKNLFRVVFAC